MSDQVRRSKEDAMEGTVIRLPTGELPHLGDDFIANPDEPKKNEARDVTKILRGYIIAAWSSRTNQNTSWMRCHRIEKHNDTCIGDKKTMQTQVNPCENDKI